MLTAEQVARYAHELQFNSPVGSMEQAIGEIMNEACYETGPSQRVYHVIRRVEAKKGQNEELDELIEKVVARIRDELYYVATMDEVVATCSSQAEAKNHCSAGDPRKHPTFRKLRSGALLYVPSRLQRSTEYSTSVLREYVLGTRQQLIDEDYGHLVEEWDRWEQGTEE